jgi:pre-rRNA-processing protein TSR3
VTYEIVLDAGETANKCTIAPLADRPDFRLFPVRGEGLIGPLSASLLLHHEGECLTRLASPEVQTLASVDCVWRRLPKLVEKLEWQNNRKPVLGRIPFGFVTAYPRVGLPHQDPEGGLATIEALFIAVAVLGHWDSSLLSRYYFGPRFIELNTDRFVELGIHRQQLNEVLLSDRTFERTALSRRRNRGRMP